MHRSKKISITTGLLTLLLAFSADAQGQLPRSEKWASDPALVRVRDLPAASALALRRRALRERAGRFEIPLFEGRRAKVLDGRLEETDGGYTWYGELEGDAGSYAAIAARGGAVVGVVQDKGTLYRIRETNRGGLALYECDPRALPDCGSTSEQVALPRTRSKSQLSSTVSPLGDFEVEDDQVPIPTSPGAPVVDVLVAWTEEAEDAAGGASAIQALIDLSILETNQAFVNSEVDLEMRLVHSSRIVYVESGDMATDLERLKATADGYMDEIHLLRDVYGADAVSLFIANDDYCGRSDNMGSPASVAFAPYAFNLVSQGCATGYYAFAHEFGHGFGLDHDRTNTSNTPSKPYAYGFWTPNNKYRTIMGLERWGVVGTRIQYFSNPNLQYLGQILGIASPSPQSADCASALNANSSIFAAWRPVSLASTRAKSPCAVGQQVVADSNIQPGESFSVVLADPDDDVTPGAFPVVIVSDAAIEPSCSTHDLQAAVQGLVSYGVGVPWEPDTTAVVELQVPASATLAGATVQVQTIYIDLLGYTLRVTDAQPIVLGL